MGISAIFSFILLKTLLQYVTAQDLGNNTLYAIQSAQDGTYLKALNNWDDCNKRGDVITSKSVNLNSASFRWIFIEMDNGRGQLDIDSHEFKSNEVSRLDRPQTCYKEMNQYRVLEHPDGDMFRLKNFQRNRCLQSHGAGMRITLERCQGEFRNQRNQFWRFEEVEEDL